jgi:site-specific DNA-methyltransferase (adenine-specific)
MKVTDKITITNEDNMALMARYPEGYFNWGFVDPPYGIGEDGAKNHSRGKATRPTMYTAKDWDSSAPSAEYFKELNRVCKNVVIWGANHFIQNISDAGINTNSSCWIVWDKDNTGDFADCELAWSNYKGAVRKFKWRWNGMLQEDMSNKETRIHPTQKPVALYKWLLDKYAKIKCDHKHSEAERYLCTDCNNGKVKILDTHLGSGSIAIACHDYGFELTACELDKEYYDKAIQRIKNHTAQTKLF